MASSKARKPQKIERVPVSSLVEDPANVRTHNSRNLEVIKGSLARFGQRGGPLVVDSNNVVRIGNGRLRAARELGWTDIDIVRADDLTEVELAALAIADNRSGELAGWDHDALPEALKGFEHDAALFAAAGFTEDELESLGYREDSDSDDGESGGTTKGENLERLAAVCLDEPRIEINKGDCWSVGPHTLVCSSVFEGWGLYSSFMDQDSLFVPYPGPTAALSEKAKVKRLVLVQPDEYICALIVEYYNAIHGSDSTGKLNGDQTD